MERLSRIIKCTVTAKLAVLWLSLPLGAQEGERLDALFEALREADAAGYERIERQIWQELGNSGSAAMDLLVTRGRDALEAGDFEAAIEHFSALVDHAPDFAEGYNGRATAFYRKGMYGPALDDIRQVLVLEPRHFGALTGLGVMLEELRFYPEALAAYREVHAIHPQEPDVAKALERLEPMVEGQEI